MPVKKGTKRKKPTPEQKAQRDFRKASETHVAVFELACTHEQARKLIKQAESIAYIKRRLRAYYRKAIEQYKRTQEYKNTIKEYHKANTKEKKQSLGEVLSSLQEKAGITEEAGRDLASYWSKRCGVKAVFGLTAFEDVWEGVEKMLYSGAKKLGAKKNTPLTLRAKQHNRGIIVKAEKDGGLSISVNGILMRPVIGEEDLYLLEEQAAIVSCLTDKNVEKKAIDNFMATGEITSTYRPKYATIVLEEIRDKWRVYAHIAIEGETSPKKKKDGGLRHSHQVDGEIGVDIGVQSYAAAGANIFVMKNLAERCGRAIKDEKRLRVLQRHADRCLRAANPRYYNEDGSIKKGKKEWTKSKEYLRTQSKIRAYHRKCALNRKYAIREDVNRLREHGSVIVSEQQSIRGWQAGFFGKSIQSRCPGTFRAELKRKFLDYIEVDLMYRASQYDHERDSYEKKRLSQRKHYHSGGRASPRDGYSGFLLWCHDSEYARPDRELCIARFDDYYERMIGFVGDCKSNGVSVVNGGF